MNEFTFLRGPHGGSQKCCQHHERTSLDRHKNLLCDKNSMPHRIFSLCLSFFLVMAAVINPSLRAETSTSHTTNSPSSSDHSQDATIVSHLQQARFKLSYVVFAYGGRPGTAVHNIEDALLSYDVQGGRLLQVNWGNPSSKYVSAIYLKEALKELNDAEARVPDSGPVHKNISSAINVVNECLKLGGV